MSKPSIYKTFVPGNNSVCPIPFKAHKVDEFSPELLEAHYEDVYGGAIRHLNKLELEIGQVDISVIDTKTLEYRKEQEVRFINEILLHEVYFDSIGESGGQKLESSSLAEAICATFSSMEEWRDDCLKLAARLGDKDGWIVLAWSKRLGRLLNLVVTDTSKGLFGVEPILTLDLCKHAYADHFGDHPVSYSEAFLRNVDWGRVSNRFEIARSINTPVEDIQPDDTQITVSQLKGYLDSRKDAPLVLDVRHEDDRERYRRRIMQTDWRDSFKVDEWAVELPKDKSVVVYCMYGFWVSQKVAEELRARGIDARSLSGGVTAWQAMGYSSSDNEF